MDVLLPVGVLVGVVLLFWGRKVFWLALAVMGFFIGFHLASEWTLHMTREMSLLAAGVGGLAGLAITLWLPRMAAAVGGFFFGFILALYTLPWIGLEGPLVLVVGLGVAILFALASSYLLRTAISLTTSFAGALMMTHSIPRLLPWEMLSILLLTLVGFFFQMRRKRRKALA